MKSETNSMWAALLLIVGVLLLFMIGYSFYLIEEIRELREQLRQCR